MLNYIWAGLLTLSLVFALWADISDLRHKTYRNGQALPVTVHSAKGFVEDLPQQDVEVRIDAERFGSFYNVKTKPAAVYPGVLVNVNGLRALRFAKGADLPEPLAKIREMTGADSNELRAKVNSIAGRNGNDVDLLITFEPVRF